MGAYAYTVTAGTSGGWRTLFDVDFSTLPSADWEGLTSVTLDGFAMPIEEAGDWTDTQLGPDGSTGVVVDPSDNTSSYLRFAPTFSGLASHYDLTQHVDDQWALVLSFASFTRGQSSSIVQVQIAEDPLGYWARVAYGNLGANVNQFRVDNNQTGGPASVTIGSVASIGIMSFVNGTACVGRFSTSETTKFGDLTKKATIYPGSISGDQDSDGEDSAWDLADFPRVGAEFASGQPDLVTLTGLSISYLPRLGAT